MIRNFAFKDVEYLYSSKQVSSYTKPCFQWNKNTTVILIVNSSKNRKNYTTVEEISQRLTDFSVKFNFSEHKSSWNG